MSRLPSPECGTGLCRQLLPSVSTTNGRPSRHSVFFGGSQREQDVFALCVGMELSYEDAALALSLPVGTVRSRLSCARVRLRELDPGSGHKQGENTNAEETSQP